MTRHPLLALAFILAPLPLAAQTEWKLAEPIVTVSYSKVVFGGGKFVAQHSHLYPANNQPHRWASESVDGVTWTHTTLPPADIFTYAGDRWWGFYQDECWVSFDGVNVERRRSAAFLRQAPIYAHGAFLGGDSQGFIWRSLNGLDWERINTPWDRSISGIFQSDDNIIAVTSAFSAAAITSTDGLTWKLAPEVTGWYTFPWYWYQDRFYAAASSSVHTSRDGFTWETKAIPNITVNGLNMCEGPDGLLMVGSSGGAALLRHGSWQALSTGVSFTLNDCAYGNGCYVAVGNAGRIIYSASSSAAASPHPLDVQTRLIPSNEVDPPVIEITYTTSNGWTYWFEFSDDLEHWTTPTPEEKITVRTGTEFPPGRDTISFYVEPPARFFRIGYEKN